MWEEGEGLSFWKEVMEDLWVKAEGQKGERGENSFGALLERRWVAGEERNQTEKIIFFKRGWGGIVGCA